MSRVCKFLARPRADQGCLLEAAGWLGLAWLVLRFVPLRRLAPFWGNFMARTPAAAPVCPPPLLQRLAWAVETAGRHLPWECTCLAQAMVGKVMLQRRGVASTLCLGLAKDGGGGLQAHAWLRCGERILTGRRGMTGFTVIASFAGMTMTE
jgi:hypothetical protein